MASNLTARHIRKKARELLEKSEAQKDVREKNPKKEKVPFVLKFGRFEESAIERAYVVVPGEVEDGGVEIVRLAETLGLEISGKKFLKKGRRINGATFLGQGTLEQIKNQIEEAHTTLVLDARLSPGQVRNLENFLKIPVLDRRTLILAIFKKNAKSHVAKLQVELAELQILKARLTGSWEGLSRQRGAAGGKGARGLGETRLELDRRALRRRIEVIKDKLADAVRAFYTQSSARSKFPRVALVGYTNAGKSSLMQALSQSETLVEDKLFATLDTTVRALQPLTHPRVLVSDTVGFVRDLPAELVASFKSTLLEALSSTLLLHVVDISDPAWKEQIAVTEDTLGEIGAADIPRIYVFNKVDVLESFPSIKKAEVRRHLEREWPTKGEDAEGGRSNFVMTSARSGEGIKDLRLKIILQCGVKE